jgi:hypothetical protein
MPHTHHKIEPFGALEAPFWDQNHHLKKWSQGIAMGDKSFVNNVKEQIGFQSKGRKIIGEEDDCQLRDG